MPHSSEASKTHQMVHKHAALGPLLHRRTQKKQNYAKHKEQNVYVKMHTRKERETKKVNTVFWFKLLTTHMPSVVAAQWRFVLFILV